MQYFKRFILLSALLALLICSMTFMVSAAQSESVLSVDVNGALYDFSLPADTTWRDLIDSESFYYANGYPVSWSADGNDNVVMIVVDGNKSYKYRLVDASESSVTGFETVYDSVFSSASYSVAEIVESKVNILVDYSRVFSFTIEHGWSWGDLCEDGVRANVDVQRREHGAVFLVFDDLYALRIRSSSGDYVSISDSIEDVTYFCDSSEFSFDVSYLGESFSLTGTAYGYSFSELIAESTVFYNEELGCCKFVYLDEGQKVVGLRIGVQADGAYIADCLLKDDRDVVHFSPDSLLYSVFEYRLLAPCTELHAVDFVVTERPTCVKPGVESGTCYLCGELCVNEVPLSGSHHYGLAEVYIEPGCDSAGRAAKRCLDCGRWEFYDLEKLGHDRDLFGTCRRCGNNSVVDAWNGSGDFKDDLWGWLQGIFDSGDDGGDAFDGWFPGLRDSIDKFLNTLKIIAFSVIAIIFLPYILKGAAWVFKHLKEAFSDIGDFFGDLSKSVKRKAVRRGK